MLSFSLVFLAICSVGIAVANHACAAGRIKVNPLVGIRTAKTMVNDKTWRSGHAAAVRPLWTSGLAAAGISLSGLLFTDSPGTQDVMALLACILMVVAVLHATRQANSAAVAELDAEQQHR